MLKRTGPKLVEESKAIARLPRNNVVDTAGSESNLQVISVIHG